MKTIINILLVLSLQLFGNISYGQKDYYKTPSILSTEINSDDIPEVKLKSVCVDEKVYLTWLNVDTIPSYYMIWGIDPINGISKLISVIHTYGNITNPKIRKIELLYCCQDPEPCNSYVQYKIEHYSLEGELLDKSERMIKITCELSYSL